ncbi:SGNH/GDSL hydrolase family protein [Ginsengibacter hankyongi]|uniref:SGNH/GDSL hydrolase family protein n=1 Tax=Ginsengibacter hankyongi TaxID=2607284 RepID=A0A5J5IGY6_9BACT|nr:SGNH/GDSL hydrolase family protein [Ginsengibacter hankyongi]KAA9039394.1 SGNH/GDSL hydrolase family protein [Ginsengibacter hankyongi]
MYKSYCYLTLFCCIAFNSFSQSKSIPYSDKHISYEGRIPFASDAAALTWPGTSVRINFKGTGISGTFKDQDTANYYNVIIDNDSIYKIQFDTAKKTVVIASGLSYGKHSLQLFKRTEWDKGKTFFYGFEFNGKNKILKPTKLPKRKIEFFGNSITCGYAIIDNMHDSPNGYFENNYDAYAAITARHYQAQYHCTSKSGIGIMVSWFPLIMPEMYNRLDPTDSTSKWDFSKYIPDVVVINLLQNDSWIVNMPDNQQFKNRFGTKAPDSSFIINAYENFVQKIRATYPKAQIICMLGNMDITRKGSPWPGYVQQAVEQLNDKKIFTYFSPYKETPGHPKVKEQQMLADGLIQFIDQHIKW